MSVEGIAFVFFVVLIVITILSFVLYIIMILQYSSFKRRMKPLNEAEKKQREEAIKRRFKQV
jgi:uncharacterized membrane protein